MTPRDIRKLGWFVIPLNSRDCWGVGRHDATIPKGFGDLIFGREKDGYDAIRRHLARELRERVKATEAAPPAPVETVSLAVDGGGIELTAEEFDELTGFALAAMRPRPQLYFTK